MVPQQSPRELADDLSLLASALDLLDFETPGLRPPPAAQTRDRLVRSIRSYLIPRLVSPGLPLTVVFAGPTGSGKSTMVNSLSGLVVSETGPIRPTTRDPVVLTSKQHSRTFERISEVDCEVVIGQAPILDRLALIDTPDIDSTLRDHRITAEILIDNADVVVFVTSALRYADRVPWEVLRRATSRGAPVIQVLNRISPDSAGSVVDFRSRLEAEGVGTDMVKVAEHRLAAGAHSVPPIAVRQLRKRLLGIARRLDEARRKSFARVLGSTVDEIVEFADALDIRIQSAELRRGRLKQAFENGARLLDLTGIWGDLAPEDPRRGTWARLWWRWGNRLSEARWAAMRQMIEQRVVAVVEGDLRRLAALGLDARSLTPQTINEIRQQVGVAVEAWFEEVGGLAETHGRGQRRLASTVLAHSATEGRPTPALRELFEDESAVVRAYRGLASRLEAIYERVGHELAASLAAEPLDAAQTDRLREVAASVVVRSHFADA